jgi:hypothetical protein
MSNLLEFASRYIEAGLSVIPVGPDKKPLIAWKKYQKQRATREEIENWIKEYEDCQIGIVTGSISSLVVFDVDSYKEGFEDKYRLPDTMTTRTGSGGRHYYYRTTEKIRNTSNKEGWDIRGEGGYVVAPPSKNEKGSYEIISGNRPIAPWPGLEFILPPKPTEKKNIFDQIADYDAMEGLTKLSGNQYVNGEVYTFPKRPTGGFYIYVNGKSSNSWIDDKGKIGSGSKGGPTLLQWLRWYNLAWRDVAIIGRTLFHLEDDYKKEGAVKPLTEKDLDWNDEDNIFDASGLTYGIEELDDTFPAIEKHHFVVLGAECFAKGTEVLLSNGTYKKINEIKEGEYVLSLNDKTNQLEEKLVTKTYCNYNKKEIEWISFTLKNGEQIKSTADHKYYFERTWVPAKDIARRKMEETSSSEGLVPDIKQGKNIYSQLEEHKEASNNETSSRWMWVLQNNVQAQRWQDKDSEDSSSSTPSMGSKSREQTICESQGFKSEEQSCREFGMGNRQGELSARIQKRKYKICDIAYNNINSKKSNEYKEEIQRDVRIKSIRNKETDQRNTRKKIQCETMYNREHNTGKTLEISSICLEDIESVSYSTSKENSYDLKIEDNHSYVVSRNNIIVHNSGSGKSTLSFWWALRNAAAGKRTMYISLEETKTGVIHRLTRERLGITTNDWRKRDKWNKEIKDRYLHYFEEIKSTPNLMVIGAAPEGRHNDISYIQEVITIKKPELVIVDNFDCIEAPTTRVNIEREELVAKFFMDFTNRYRIPIICIHHFKKNQFITKKRDNESFKGSAKIAHNADMIFIYKRLLDGEVLSNVAALTLTKNRDFGSCVMQHMCFVGGEFKHYTDELVEMQGFQ